MSKPLDRAHGSRGEMFDLLSVWLNKNETARRGKPTVDSAERRKKIRRRRQANERRMKWQRRHRREHNRKVKLWMRRKRAQRQASSIGLQA